MGWFDEQIRQRKQNDNDVFADSFINMAGAVMGKNLSSALNSEQVAAQNAIEEILRFYHVKIRQIPDDIKSVEEQLEYMTRSHGIMRRTVQLTDGWYQNSVGAMLGVRKSDGSVVALIPTGFSGYSYLDSETGKYKKIKKENQKLFESEAIAFYKPFPLQRLTTKDLMRYVAETVSFADGLLLVAAVFMITLFGMFLPKLNHIVFSRIIVSGSVRLLLAVSFFMVCVAISLALVTAVKGLITSRINTKISVSVQAASVMRIMSMPADFFKQYASGELASVIQQIQELCNMLVTTVLSFGLTAIFALLYVSQIFTYAKALAKPALLTTVATVLIMAISVFVQMRVSREQMELKAEESGMSYALISGIQKIKLAGAEKRAFARWGNLYAKELKQMYNPPVFLKINSAVLLAVSLCGTFAIYYTAVKSQVSVADYYAFHTAYSMISGAFLSLAAVVLTAAKIKPILDMARPVLENLPEISEEKQMVKRLSGGIELSNVSFRYSEKMPLVADNLSFRIRPGQYVAIVGATGCGKSTLMRMMLGFETPQKGAVYYDGKDLSTIDLKSLHKNIGVVLQNGKLFQGDIYSNITIAAPQMTLDEAWEAAEIAGLADDIRRMPMGMHTIISEGNGGISGGQRQRIMIARAIASKPKILMFDEATSALDNVTQKRVAQSLDGLKCTRIVIAHRLSTIQQCDRVLVLDHGKIIEDGTYDELMARNGFFAELVERQQLNRMERGEGRKHE